MDLYACINCRRSVASSEALPINHPCPWCWHQKHDATSMTHVNVAIEPVDMVKQYPPGTLIRHRLSGQELMVLELEGDGSSGWFTARAKDFTTHRIRYTEVSLVAESDKAMGQYL